MWFWFFIFHYLDWSLKNTEKNKHQCIGWTWLHSGTFGQSSCVRKSTFEFQFFPSCWMITKAACGPQKCQYIVSIPALLILPSTHTGFLTLLLNSERSLSFQFSKLRTWGFGTWHKQTNTDSNCKLKKTKRKRASFY